MLSMTKQALSDEDRKEVVLYRLEKAQHSYEEEITNIQHGYVEIVGNEKSNSIMYSLKGFGKIETLFTQNRFDKHRATDTTSLMTSYMPLCPWNPFL